MLQKTNLNILGKITAVTIFSAAAVFLLNTTDAKAETINVSSDKIANTEASYAIQATLNSYLTALP